MAACVSTPPLAPCALATKSVVVSNIPIGGEIVIIGSVLVYFQDYDSFFVALEDEKLYNYLGIDAPEDELEYIIAHQVSVSAYYRLCNRKLRNTGPNTAALWQTTCS